jgi:hypothetical protein
VNCDEKYRGKYGHEVTPLKLPQRMQLFGTVIAQLREVSGTNFAHAPCHAMVQSSLLA